MEKNNEKGKNIVIGILIGIIICLAIVLIFISYNKFTVKDASNTNTNNSDKNTIEEKQENTVIPTTHKIEFQEKNGSCTGMNFTYKELFVDNKKIDLGFTSNSNSCEWTFINDYEKTDDFIVLKVTVGYVEGSSKLYIIDYDGNILKTTEDKDVFKYYIENNSVYAEMYGVYQDPCYAKKDDVAGGLYKLEYLGNNKFSEIQKVKDKTVNDMLKLQNLDYDTFCKH